MSALTLMPDVMKVLEFYAEAHNYAHTVPPPTPEHPHARGLIAPAVVLDNGHQARMMLARILKGTGQ